MLDYTQAAWRQTVQDFKKVLFVLGVAVQTVYIFYLIYALVFSAGVLATVVNAALLFLCAGYLAFFLYATQFGKDPDAKKFQAPKRLVDLIVKWGKRAIRLVTIGFAVYEISTAKSPDLLSVLFTALMIVGWAMQIVCDVLVKILVGRFNFLKEGLEADINEITRPFRATGNFFKKMVGKEVTPEKEPTKNQLLLKEKAAEYKAEQKQKKQTKADEWKKEQAIARADKKRERADLKKSTRAERALLKQAAKKEKANKRAPAPDVPMLPPANEE